MSGYVKGNFTKCKYIKGDGVQCKASAGERGYCYQHDPDVREERANTNARAAVPPRASLGKPIRRPKTMDDLERIIATATKGLWEGTVDHKRATAIMHMCKFHMKLIKERESEKPPQDDVEKMSAEELEEAVKKLVEE